MVLLASAGIAYYVRVDVSAAPTELTFDTVSRGDVVATVEATGTLQPLDTVQVGTQVSGTIASIGTDFNQVVNRGQVLHGPAGLLQELVDIDASARLGGCHQDRLPTPRAR